MKSIIKLPAMILGLLLLITGPTQKVMAQEDDISLETFYEELAPYGRWTQDPQYGYVWRPDVDQRNFRPYYTDGHWTMTDYGNTWVSDYEWGWGPFHYGRWVLDRYDQWIWIPDTVWGPAWVSWRSGDGYYGWAPLGPDYQNINDGMGYNAPLNWWVFIPQINIYSTSYPRYYFRDQSFYNRTAFINYTYRGPGRRYYYTGPRVNDIRRATRRDVTVYRLTSSDRPGRSTIVNNNINIYRPKGGSGGRNSNNNVVQPGQNNRTGDRERGRDRRTNPTAGTNQPDRPNNTPDRNNNNAGRGAAAYTPTQDNTRVRGQRPSATGSDGSNRFDQQRQVQDLEQRQQQMQRRQRDGQFDQQRQQRRTQREQQMDQGQRQQQDQQRQQQMQQQRQQQDQQRQQQMQQQRQQQDQQRQQQMQHRQQQMQQRPAGDPGRGGRGGRGN